MLQKLDVCVSQSSLVAQESRSLKLNKTYGPNFFKYHQPLREVLWSEFLEPFVKATETTSFLIKEVRKDQPRLQKAAASLSPHFLGIHS